MNISLVASPLAFDHALQTARTIGQIGKIEGLNAVIDASMMGKVEEAWGSIEKALKTAYQYGKEQVHGALEAAIAKATQMLAEAGNRAREFQFILLQRLQAFMRDLIEQVVALVPSVLNVGGSSFSLSSMKCTQKIALTGSLKTSLTEVFSLVSEGQLEVETEY